MKLSFRAKVPLVVISLLLLFGLGLSLIISHIASQALVAENKKRGISSAVNLAARVVEPLLAMDFLQLKNLVDAVVQTDDDISYTFLLDKAGEPLVHNFTGGFPVDLKKVNLAGDQAPFSLRLVSTGKELIYDIAVPVLIGKDRLGTVRLGMSRSHVADVVNRLLWAIFISTGLGILLAAFVGAALARPVTRKIHHLHHAAEEIIKGNLHVRTAPLPKHHCWELKHCTQQECPAYGDRESRCWYLAGTLCPRCLSGRYEQKISACQQCPIYRNLSGDELQNLAEFFDIMVHTLRERLEALKQSEANLKQQQQLFQTILDVTPDLVSLQDRRLRYQAVNKAFCRFVNKDEGAVLGRSDFDLFPADQTHLNQREDRQVIASGETLRREKKITGPAGARWLHVVKTPVTTPEGRIIGLLVNGRDITEMKLLYDRIMRAQKLESLGQLAAGIAHEINTPLGIILGNAQLSLEDVDPGSELADNLRAVEKYARICRNIVADLLRFSRHTEGVKKPLQVNEVLTQVIAVVEHSFGLDNITLERHFAPDLPLVVGDQEKLQQVFINLLNNAYDAIDRGGAVIVSTGCEDSSGEVVITVADTGPGIPPEISDRIFDPFFTTKGVGEGTGLGLSVTFGIVKDHGGRIDFRSPWIFPEAPGSPPHGTLFTLRLPAAVPESQQEAIQYGQDSRSG